MQREISNTPKKKKKTITHLVKIASVPKVWLLMYSAENLEF